MTSDRFTEGRLTERLGAPPPRLPGGGFALAGAKLTRMSLTKAHLADSDLHGADLRGCDLLRADLRFCKLGEADLSDAKLAQTDLRGADLRGANLSRAVVHGAEVDGCQLAGAELAGSTWHGVALWRTDLAPEALATASEVAFGDALRQLGPHDAALPVALRWLVTYGGHEDLAALHAVVGDRRWRPAREQLRLALTAMSQRLGPLSDASLSRATPTEVPTERSLSRWRDDAGEHG